MQELVTLPIDNFRNNLYEKFCPIPSVALGASTVGGGRERSAGILPAWPDLSIYVKGLGSIELHVPHLNLELPCRASLIQAPFICYQNACPLAHACGQL